MIVSTIHMTFHAAAHLRANSQPTTQLTHQPEQRGNEQIPGDSGMDSLQLRQERNDTTPKKRVHFARKVRQRRIARIDSALKKDLFYSPEDYEGFGRDLQEEENGLFVVFNILSEASPALILENV
jgi:hypothetical protein